MTKKSIPPGGTRRGTGIWFWPLSIRSPRLLLLTCPAGLRLFRLTAGWLWLARPVGIPKVPDLVCSTALELAHVPQIPNRKPHAFLFEMTAGLGGIYFGIFNFVGQVDCVRNEAQSPFVKIWPFPLNVHAAVRKSRKIIYQDHSAKARNVLSRRLACVPGQPTKFFSFFFIIIIIFLFLSLSLSFSSVRGRPRQRIRS